MSVEYTIEVRRKVDNKKIAEIYANQLKGIMDSEFDGMIHCDHRSADNVKFEYSDLDNVENAAFKKIKEIYSKIFENKLLMPMAKSVEIKREYEDDNRYYKEAIDDLQWVLVDAAFLKGQIACVTENLFKRNKAAYQYNGDDLPAETKEYGDGNKYEEKPYIWVNDVYCVIKAC